jgi:hypothetical protein
MSLVFAAVWLKEPFALSVISAAVLIASPVLLVIVVTAPPTVSFKELFIFSATSDTLRCCAFKL